MKWINERSIVNVYGRRARINKNQFRHETAISDL